MKISNAAVVVSLLFGAVNMASAQTANTYQETCIENQAKIHKKLKNIPPNHFRDFCDCTYKYLSSNLSQAQLDELKKNNRPSWLKPAEEAAGKSCLAIDPKLQA